MEQGAFDNCDIAPLPLDHGPAITTDETGGTRFLVTVDTEEEFDWNAPFSRDNRGTEHIAHISDFQKQASDHGVKPVYLTNCAIIENDAAVEIISGFVDSGAANIGLHLHPWLTPPYDEEVNDKNSYGCNLPPALEQQKIINLFENMQQRFGIKPEIFRAGRYGAGAYTPEILAAIGIKIDSSLRPRFDYSKQYGPDFSFASTRPYWLRDNLMELPVTTVFTGAFRGAGDLLFAKWFKSDLARAAMAKAGLVERVALTPEGIPLDKAIQGIDRALEENISILNFSFHSPSAAIGYTPYVQDKHDLDDFYAWWDGVYAHLAKCGIKPISLDDLTRIKQK